MTSSAAQSRSNLGWHEQDQAADEQPADDRHDRGKKCVFGPRTNKSPASTVTPPAAIANGRDFAAEGRPAVSIRPAAISSAPIMSEEMLLPAGRKAAPTLRRMIAMPATREPRRAMRSDKSGRGWLAKSTPNLHLCAANPAEPRWFHQLRRDDPQRPLRMHNRGAARRRRPRHPATRECAAATPNAQPLDAIDLLHVVVAGAIEQGADACRDQSAARLLAHDHDAELPVLQALALPRSAKVEAISLLPTNSKGVSTLSFSSLTVSVRR